MPITVRGKKFQATVHSKGKRYRRQFPSIKDAQLWELQTLTELATGKTPQVNIGSSTPVRPERKLPETLKEGFDYTYKTSWVDIASGREMRRNGDMLLQCLGQDVPMKDIDKLCIDGIVSSLREQGNKNGTINRKLTALSKVLRTAEELGVIQKKPKIPYLKEAAHRVRWYTDEELQKMIDYCNDHDPVFAKYLIFMVDTGLRQGEAAAMRWEDHRWPAAIYIPNSKNGLPRASPLTKRALEALLWMQHDNHETAEFFNRHNSTDFDRGLQGPWDIFTPNLLRQKWSDVRKHMGWEDDPQAVLHTLRHTFCSRLIQKGAPLKMVQELAGHKRIEMTLRYAHLAPHNLSTCIDLLN